jgi:3-oxoacyl-[acyl-carrier-protein] synthase II
MTRRRVAVTGLGVVTAVGVGRDAFWDGLLAAQPEGERRVTDFDPTAWFDNPKEARRADRFTQFALAAASEALEQSGAIESAPERRGVVVGTGVGGLGTIEENVLTLDHKGPRRVSPFLVPMMMSNAAAAAISMRHGWQGPCETIVTACATGTQCVGYAARLIEWGHCDAVVAGSSEAAMTPTGVAGFANMTALSSDGVSRPFDADRTGFVMSEGAGIVVLEAWDHAVARGAAILGEVLGSASTADAHHITAPSPGGMGAVRCMERALDDAGLQPSDIAHVNAHGTSTPLNDAAEAEAMAKVFGAPGPIITSTKGVTGHALGAAGAIEVAAVLLAMQHRLIPPTDGLVAVDPAFPTLDIVTGGARPWEPGPSLSNSFGFGGHNATVVIGPPA